MAVKSASSTSPAAIVTTLVGAENSGPKRARKVRRLLRNEYEDTEQLARRNRPSVVDTWLANLERMSTSDEGRAQAEQMHPELTGRKGRRQRCAHAET